ncbi:MAG: hypothetical protein ASARMPREDX12_007994 [Alectoria sarmentosa]|nr:MAG: hypothetical protein ASARMPREDX12_007994 [Alectoria sarmentosa]
MKDLAFMDQNAELPLTQFHSWSLPQYDIIVDVASTRVRWAIYGLQLTIKMISTNPVAFQPYTGLNAILLTADPDISTIADNNSNNKIITLHSPQLQVVPTYNGLPMTSNYILAIALTIMALGAEKGPQQACNGIRDGSFDMIPILDTQGQSLLKFHSLIKAMRVLTRLMVAKNKFGEVDVELWRDGVVIGIGRLKKASTGVAGL